MNSQPKHGGKFPPSDMGTRRKGVKPLPDLEALTEYRFLKAALEDVAEVQVCASREPPNQRHVVCLMFDALEFILYEILLLREQDIYKTGQNTIGFDDALSMCKELRVEIPLIGTVRDIQKHRGDAKHHAQAPDNVAYQRLLGNFDIIVSRLVYEQFEQMLDDEIRALPLLSHRVALFESYRRRRNHNWEQAYRFILGAMLRKHNEMFGNSSGMAFDFAAGHKYQLEVLDAEIAAADYTVAPVAAAITLKNLVAQVRGKIENVRWKEGASLIGEAFSISDRLLPGIFDIKQAKTLTPKLYQPAGFHHGRPMAWSRIWGRAGSETAALIEDIRRFLSSNKDVVAKFGRPYYEEDDDRYWRWWEFAIFDGERWHTFHLNTSFDVSLESGPDSSSDRDTSTDLLKLIGHEFRNCNPSEV